MKIFSNMSFSLIGFLYTIVAGALCYILPIHEIVKGFLALPGFLIIPYLFGSIFAHKRIFEKQKSGYKKISQFIIIWMLGFIIWTIGATILKGANLFNLFYYIIFTFALIGIKISYTPYSQKCHFTEITHIFSSIRTHYSAGIIIIIIIFIAIFLHIGTTPFPTINGGDIFRFSLDVHQTIKNHSIFFQYGTYFSYLTLFVSSLSTIFNLHPFTLFWTGAWFLFFCFCFGIYLLSYHISNNKFFSLITVLFAVLPISIYTCLSAFQPQVWLYVVLPYVIFVIQDILHEINKIELKNLTKTGIISLIITFISYVFSFKLTVIHPNDDVLVHVLYFILTWIFIVILLRIIFNTKDSISIGTVFACLIMLHHPTSFIVIACLVIYIGLHFLTKYSITYFYVISIILVLSIVIAIIFQIPASIHPTGIFTDVNYNLGFSGKFDMLPYTLSSSTMFLFVIGSLYIILRRQIEYLAFVVISFIVLFVYFIDIDILVRSLYFFIVFAVLVVSMGFLFVSEVFYRLCSKKKESKAVLLVIVLVCSFGPIFNYINDAQSIGAISLQTFTKEEYNAAIFIEKNFSNAIIISDYWTELIFSGISGVQNVGTCEYTGRAKQIIASSDPLQAYNLSKVFSRDFSKDEKEEVFKNETIRTMIAKGFDVNLTNKDTIIIITSRSIRDMLIATGKIQISLTKNKIEPLRFITSDMINNNSPQIKKFYNKTYFTPLYIDTEHNIYIFGVNPEPGVPFKLQNTPK